MDLGVIFDMDGVLVLTEQAHWQSWRDTAQTRNVQVAYETFLSCFGRVNDDCIRIMFGTGLPEDESRRIADEKEAAFRRIIGGDVPLAPRARELLAELIAAGSRIGVGSSAPPENVNLVLDAGRIRGYFRAIVDGSQVKRGKPAPDVFLLAGEQLGITATRCAVIEDAPAGIRAARAAGMTAIGVATTHTADQLLESGAHEVLPTLADVTVDGIRRAIGR